jgi:hypothetical protein
MAKLRVLFPDRVTPKGLKGNFVLDKIKGRIFIARKYPDSEELKFIVLPNGRRQRENALIAWFNRKRLTVARITSKELEEIMRLIGDPIAEPGLQ